MSYSDYLDGLRDGASIGFKAGFRAGWEVGQKSGYLSGYEDGYYDGYKNLPYEPEERFREHKRLFPDPPIVNVDISLIDTTPKMPNYKLPICDPPKLNLNFDLDPASAILETMPKINSQKKPWER